MPKTRMRPLAFLLMKTSSPVPEKKSIVLLTFENLVRLRECEVDESNIFKLWPNVSILVCTVDYQSFIFSISKNGIGKFKLKSYNFILTSQNGIKLAYWRVIMLKVGLTRCSVI